MLAYWTWETAEWFAWLFLVPLAFYSYVILLTAVDSSTPQTIEKLTLCSHLNTSGKLF
ncbi:hypothetical protein STRDD10_00557 [Streptococcus sp. DD10]|nr:hypothetical protein STRDD10_00557 [Streptococcus sp. DD10]